MQKSKCTKRNSTNTIQNCIDTFTQVAEHPDFTYVGNVEIGDSPSQLPLAEMAPHYDALLFAYGASEDRRLGIPGEDLEGIFSARAFVGWYNGLPEYAGLSPKLDSSDSAVIIGQGNVAMDVARILLAPLNHLRQTDITEEALEVLSRSRVKDVNVVGRRGPLQAAFTTKELRELMNLDGVHFDPSVRSLLPENIKSLPRLIRRSSEVMVKGSRTAAAEAHKQWALQFYLSPTAFEASSDASQLGAVHFQQMTPSPLSESADLSSVETYRSQRSHPLSDAHPVSFNTGLAFRSVGYKSVSIPGLKSLGVPFDDKLGIIPNDPAGRILSASAGPGDLAAVALPGLYAAGWVKRGPTGVIASTMDDAFATADALRMDWEGEVKFLPGEVGDKVGWNAVKMTAEKRGIRSVSWSDWLKIDKEERRRGEQLGKAREKFASVAQMLQVLDG